MVQSIFFFFLHFFFQSPQPTRFLDHFLNSSTSFFEAIAPEFRAYLRLQWQVYQGQREFWEIIFAVYSEEMIGGQDHMNACTRLINVALTKLRRVTPRYKHAAIKASSIGAASDPTT